MFNKKIVIQESKKYDSFYLYDETKILEYTNNLKDNFEDVKFLYSVKTNPNQMVVKSVLSQGFGTDAASVAEVMLSNKYGVTKDMILYSAPGKTIKDIESTIDISTIIADSINEISLIQKVAKDKDIVASIGLRINPDFSFYSGNGLASKFGIDENQVFENIEKWNGLENIKITGIHVHLRSQELNEDVIKRYYENIFDLALRVEEKIGHKLKFINMGSGIGIPYATTDKSLNISDLGQKTKAMINGFKKNHVDTEVFIETGRYAVGKSGVYVTKVLDKKISHGETFVILNNTLNGFIRPSIACLITSYAKDEELCGSEPLFTSSNAFDFTAVTEETDTETVTLVGNLCTATDVVAKNITMPKLRVGDIVVINNAGSYAAALSPMQFSSQIPPVELFLNKDGEVYCS